MPFYCYFLLSFFNAMLLTACFCCAELHCELHCVLCCRNIDLQKHVNNDDNHDDVDIDNDDDDCVRLSVLV